MTTMIGSFKYNYIDSSTFDLVCRSIKRPLLPPMKTNYIEMPGRSGIFDFGGNEYDIRELTMQIGYIGRDYFELRSRARDIANWLSSKQLSPLILNDEPDKYYLARVADGVDLNTLWESGTAEITFICQPFAYFITSTCGIPSLYWDTADIPWESAIPIEGLGLFDFTTTVPTTITFNNPGNRQINFKSPQGSMSLIKINGSWTTLSLIINGGQLNYTESGSGELIIDNVNMNVKLNNINALGNISGDIDTFLEILPGVNTMDIQGTGLNISITMDFIPMWI